MASMASEDIASQQPAATLADLANEIVARIFSAGTVTWREEYPNRLPFPLLVSSVCRSWKLLAYSTPELWSFIIPPLHLLETAEDGENWTSQWLTRSGSLHVSIVIDDRLRTQGRHTVQESQAVVLGVLRGIGPHSHRLRRLDIWSQHVYPNDLNSLFQNSGKTIQLRQLSLCCDRITQTQILPNSSAHTAVMFSWFERLPRLHKLRVSGAIFPVVSPLTSLSVHGLCARFSEIQGIFSTCPNLKSLVLPDLLPIAFPLPSPAPRVPVTSLKFIAFSLKPVSRIDGNPPYLFSVLQMPNVEYLEIDGDVEISRVFDGSLNANRIERLRFSNRSKGLNKEDQSLVRSFNGLRHLELLYATTEGLLWDTSGSPVMDRKRSIGSLFSFSPSSLTPLSHESWPVLADVTLGTNVAEDVMRLCRFVNLHRGIKSVRLSRMAKRLLSGSLVRNNDIVYVKEPRKRKGSPSSGTNDVEDWLGKLVEVKSFRNCCGMFDREQLPLQYLW